MLSIKSHGEILGKQENKLKNQAILLIGNK